MNFQNIPPVEGYQFYLDLAFRRAREKGKKLRGTKLKGGRLEKSRYIELMKMQVIADTVMSRSQKIVKNFPSLDQLPDFYLALVKLTLDYGQFKKSLGSVHWLSKRTNDLFRKYKDMLKKNKQFDRISVLKTQFLGRLSSLVKQVKTDFIFLEEARKVMKGYPAIKTGLTTIALAGFPNVGKTTLLHKLTGSKADIHSYPFTTKNVNVGYVGKGKSRIQFLDTPGTLDRFEKMNNIEKIAYLAIKHCASQIVYVFDPTEEYPMDKQVKLFKRLKKDFKLPILVYVSKTDKMDASDLVKKYDAFVDVKELKEKLV